MSWYFNAITNYVNFKGRERRRAYWMFVLVNVIITIVISCIDVIFIGIDDGFFQNGVLSTIYSIFIFLPSLSLTVRRLHDTGRCGWWVLLYFIPIVGWIIMLVFLCTDSYGGENQYGPCPKQRNDEEYYYNQYIQDAENSPDSSDDN